MEGWIKLHRQIIDNPMYFSEPFSRVQAWIDLILIANHKDGYFFKRGIKVDVKIGQVGYDIETLSERWKWSRGKVERFLKHLENEQTIVRQKNNITTLISIVKYKEYQTNNKANNKANGHQIIKQTDTNKNKENENNENNELPTEVLKPLTLYQLCVDYWLKEFHPDWTFEAVHGKNLKSIIKKIQTMQGNNGKVVSDENGFTAFKFMCDNLPEFFKDKDLQVINSKFNEIIEQIKNKSNGHHQTQSPYRS